MITSPPAKKRAQQKLRNRFTIAERQWFGTSRTAHQAEVDFVLQRKQAVIPIEVKVYAEQFQPEQAIRFSMADYQVQDWLMNVPLYGVATLGK